MSEIVASFTRLVHDCPEKPLVYFPARRETWTVADLWASSVQLGAILERAEIHAGQLVVSAAGNCPLTMALTVACRRLGVALLPLDSGTAFNQARELATRFGAAAVVTETSAVETPTI